MVRPTLMEPIAFGSRPEQVQDKRVDGTACALGKIVFKTDSWLLDAACALKLELCLRSCAW